MTDAQSPGTERGASCFQPCASNSTDPWFCVFTRPQLEYATEHRLRSQGASAWLPMEAFRKANRQSVIRVIFPRYLFVQSFPYTVVRNAGGEEMARLLVSSTTGKPIALPAREMAALLIQCAPNGVIYPAEPREVTFKDTVRIEDGPLTGFTGICQRTTRDRVWILLNLFGRQSEVEFARKHVELIA